MKIIDKLKGFSIDKNVVTALIGIGVTTYCLITYGENLEHKESENMITRLKDHNDELHMQNIEFMNQINKLQDAQ